MNPNSKTTPPAPPVEMARIAAASQISGLPRTRLYGLRKKGLIRMVKCGRSTLVCMASVRAYLANLPEA